MGLGAKIKGVLSSDHHNDTTATHATSSHTASTPVGHKTPGAYPSDDLPQRHTDGKEYIAPHGTAVNDAKWKESGAHAAATSGGTLSSSGTQRNRLSPGTAESDSSYDPEYKLNTDHRIAEPGGNASLDKTTATGPHASSGAYWGDLSHGSHGAGSRELPEHLREGNTATSGQHHGTTGGALGRQHDRHLPSDQAIGGGSYNTEPAQRIHAGSATRDPTQDSHFGADSAGVDSRHRASTNTHRDHLAGPSGVGIYQSSAGANHPGHLGSRSGQQTGAAHNALSSGSDYNHRDTAFHGDGLSTSQHDRTGHGRGLAGAGAAAGVGAAAGYGGNEHGHNKHTRAGHAGSSSNASDGVPRSSMLDPEPAFNNSHNSTSTYSGNPPHTRTGVSHSGAGFHNSNSPTSAHPGTTGYNDAEGVHGPHSSRIANAADPRVDSDRDHRGAGSGLSNSYATTAGRFSGEPPSIDTNAGAHTGFGAPASPTQSASSGSGRKHFGPGHEGAKVLHACTHCGRDNDISQYFSKDVVYRLGQ